MYRDAELVLVWARTNRKSLRVKVLMAPKYTSMQQVTHRYSGIQLITSQLSGDSSSGEHITQKEISTRRGCEI